MGFLLSFCRGCSLGPLGTKQRVKTISRGKDRGSHRSAKARPLNPLIPSRLSPNPQPPASTQLLSQTGNSQGSLQVHSEHPPPSPATLDCFKSEPMKVKG